MKEDNPYKDLVAMYHDFGKASALQPMPSIGKIVSPPPEIVVEYNGMHLDKKYLWIDEYWLKGHTRTHKGHIVSATQNRSGGGGYALFASHNHDIDNDFTDIETLTDTWKVGDRVLLLPIVGSDNKTTEQFVIMAKLKRLDNN